MPQRFQGQRAVEQRQAVAEAALATWWTGFDDPQLTRFVTLALAQNLDLAQAAARVTQARAGPRCGQCGAVAFGQCERSSRTRLPVGRNAVGARAELDARFRPSRQRLRGRFHRKLGTGCVRRVAPRAEAALADYQASEAAAVATRLAVAAQTADIYITIRGLQGRLKVARHQVQTEQDLLSTINLLYGKGPRRSFRSGRPKVRSLRSAQRCRYSKRRWTRR